MTLPRVIFSSAEQNSKVTVEQKLEGDVKWHLTNMLDGLEVLGKTQALGTRST